MFPCLHGCYACDDWLLSNMDPWRIRLDTAALSLKCLLKRFFSLFVFCMQSFDFKCNYLWFSWQCVYVCSVPKPSCKAWKFSAGDVTFIGLCRWKLWYWNAMHVLICFVWLWNGINASIALLSFKSLIPRSSWVLFGCKGCFPLRLFETIGDSKWES